MRIRVVWCLVAAITLFVLLALMAALLSLRGSLPGLDGQRPLQGLTAPARVERDALGVVTVTAGSQTDMARALGYVHAQERFFEMDLTRRSAAGELAALFGEVALKRDIAMRPHRLRARAQEALKALPVADQRLLEAYVDGVNTGLSALRVRPAAYLLMRQAPRPWTAEDSLLVPLAMYADLQAADLHDEPRWHDIRAHAPPALLALLRHPGSRHDAPLQGPSFGDAPLPTARMLDLRASDPPTQTGDQHDTLLPGSNNFAVAGSLTADGRAIVADDMHLGLRAPNIWFRARLKYPSADAPGGQVDVSGFTLPGLPAVIVGSNGHVAWGFTNSYIDTSDYARYDAALLATPGVVTEIGERIAIAGGKDHILTVRETAFGPLLHSRPDGSALALRWTAHLPGAVNLGLAAMAHAQDVTQALALADHAGVPAQNLVIGDAGGRIAWRLIGTRPDRAAGCAPGVLLDIRLDGQRCPPWNNRTDAAPTLIDPAHGRLWTANNRVVDPATLAIVGSGGYDLGARSKQIRDGLFARERFAESDMLAIALDDRALLLEPWYHLLRQTIVGTDDPALQRLQAVTQTWEGHARPSSVSYRITRAFRGMLLDRIEASLLAPVQNAIDKDWKGPRLGQLEGIVWPMIEQRPAHLLPAGAKDWDELLADTARALVADLDQQGDDLSQRTWGERNTARICHPLQMALPALTRRWLCMPADELNGDNNMPLVAAPEFGASQRMVVAPGHEADGIVHMPGGQSGHPLSPFWGAGHEDWVKGRAMPFLPGKTAHTLTLAPTR